MAVSVAVDLARIQSLAGTSLITSPLWRSSESGVQMRARRTPVVQIGGALCSSSSSSVRKMFGDEKRSAGVVVRSSSRVHVEESSNKVRHANPAEELLEQWAREPAAGASGKNAETEAVRRLFMWDSLPKQEEVQIFSLYEINEFDRDSPAFLPFSAINLAKSKPANSMMEGLQNLWSTLSGAHVHGLGDLVPFSNKLYDSSLKLRLGVTAGLTMVVKAYPGKGQKHHKRDKVFFPDRYEAMYTFYLGDMGHVSAQGPFASFEDTLLTITGGAGLFREAKGVIHLHNITPFKLFYTFHIRSIPELPRLLTAKPVEPNEFVKPHPEAVACKPGFALPNYTD